MFRKQEILNKFAQNREYSETDSFPNSEILIPISL